MSISILNGRLIDPAHAIDDVGDAEDFVARVQQFDRAFDQVIEEDIRQPQKSAGLGHGGQRLVRGLLLDGSLPKPVVDGLLPVSEQTKSMNSSGNS